MAEHEPMVEVFIYETRQFLEQLEQRALASEDNGSFRPEDVNEISGPCIQSKDQQR